MKKIIMFALVISSVLIPVISMNVQDAYAVTPSKISTGANRNVIEIQYQNTTGKIWALSSDPTGTGTKTYLHSINPINNTVSATYNITQSTSLFPQTLWCGKTDCFVGFHDSGYTAGRITKYASLPNSPFNTGDQEGVYNTSAGRGVQFITGRDAVSGGFGSITLYWAEKVATTNMRLNIFDGINMGNTASLTLETDHNWLNMQWSGISGITDNTVVISGSNSADHPIMRIYDVSAQVSVCNVSPNSNTAIASSLFLDYPNSKIFLGTDVSGELKVYNKSCVLQTTYSSTTTGLGAQIRDTSVQTPYNDNVKYMYAMASGSSGLVSEIPYSAGVLSTFNTQQFNAFPSTSQSAFIGHFQFVPTQQKLFIPYSGADNGIFVLNFSSGGTTQGSTGVDCSLPANANILICYLTSQTGGSLGGAGGIISTGFFNLATNSGLISGSDHNVKTNGIGYLIVAVSLAILITIFWIASNGQLNEIPTFVWFIGVIAVVGSLTAIGFVDPTFLIISIIVVVAFAVSKVSRSLFAGGFGSQGFSGEG